SARPRSSSSQWAGSTRTAITPTTTSSRSRPRPKSEASTTPTDDLDRPKPAAKRYPPRVTGRVDLEAADRRLTSYVDRLLSRAAARAGGELVCRPGCAECCAGPFPITQVDALRLRRGLADLAARDPLRAARVMRRAREAAALLGADLPADERSHVLSS